MNIANADKVKKLLRFREKLIEMKENADSVINRGFDEQIDYELAKFIKEDLSPVFDVKIDGINKQLAKL